MAILFSGGFENGDFSEFDGVTAWGGAIATVQQNRPHSGLFNAVFSTPSEEGYFYAACVKGVDPQKTMGAEGFFFVNSSLPLPQLEDKFYFIVLEGTEAVAFVGIKQTWEGLKWTLMSRNGVEYVSGIGGSPVSGRYYHVKVVWHNDATNGWAQLYVDGVLITEVTGVDTSTYGDCIQANFGIAQKAGTAFLVEVFADDITITGELPPVLLSYESTPILVDATINGTPVSSGSSVQVPADSSVTISVPSQVETYYFNHWLINDVRYEGNPIQITVTADTNIVAVYSEEKPPPPEIPWIPIAVGTGIASIAIIVGVYLLRKKH